MKTEAAVLVETGRKLEIASLTIPPLKQGQVLVEIAYSGMCGTQVLEVRGDKGEDRWLPHCLGHEASGVVRETGPGVTHVAVGDPVVLSWLKGPGIEAGGSAYDWNGRRVNAGAVTTFQRLALVSENRITRLPDGFAMDLAVLLGCAAPTGIGAVANVLKAASGSSVAVFGVGGIGLHACMAAAFAGCAPVIAIDPNPDRRALAGAFGATHILDPAAGDPVEAVRALVPGGVDAAVESSGSPLAMRQAMEGCRAQGGRAVVIGNARFDAVLSLSPALFNQGKSLLGTWGGDSRPERDFAAFAELLAAGRFPVRRLLSAPYSLAETAQALQDLAAGRVGRPLIDMSLG
jgi:S-(hydroxymethyl)glutathione dehydrogenase / alcohol dehydrogenase